MAGVGVQISTTTRSAPGTLQRVASSTYFVTGQTQRGPSNAAVKVTSLADYVRLYGDRVSYGSLYDDLQTFFEEGGTAAYVARTVGPSASVATATLVDRAETPVSTLRLDAYGPGDWAQDVTYAVADGTTDGTFKLTIVYSGVGAGAAEVYDNLVTPADAVTALLSSAYVRGTDLGSASDEPDNQPAVVSATALSGGSDDRGSITSTHYTNALDLFTEGLGTGFVAIPGQPASAIGVALGAHCEANNRIAVPSTAIGQSKSQAVSAAASFANGLSSGYEFVGLAWPWIKIPDGSGGTRTISPEGFIAAKRAQCHETFGPAQPPGAGFGAAGGSTRVPFVLDTETALTKADIDDLNASKVSPIAVVNGTVELYGWRSLSTDAVNYTLLSSRDTMNYIAVGLNLLMEQFVFRTIDGKGQLFAEMANAAKGFLEPLRVARQLFEGTDANGNIIDPGYRVDTGPSVNTTITKQANEAHILVTVRPSPAAQLVVVQIAKVPVSGSV